MLTSEIACPQPVRARRVAMSALALLAAGCGGDDEARSEQRRPCPSTSRSRSGPSGMTVSPAEFGAGPVTLLIAQPVRRFADAHDRRPAAAAHRRPDHSGRHRHGEG